MATQTATQTKSPVGFVRDLGNSYLDSTATTFETIADIQDEAGKMTNIGVLAGVGGFQAEVTRSIGETYVAVGRKLIG